MTINYAPISHGMFQFSVIMITINDLCSYEGYFIDTGFQLVVWVFGFFLSNFQRDTARHLALTVLTKVTILHEQQNQKYNQSPDVLQLPLDIFRETMWWPSCEPSPVTLNPYCLLPTKWWLSTLPSSKLHREPVMGLHHIWIYLLKCSPRAVSAFL